MPKSRFRQSLVPEFQKSQLEGFLDAPKVLDACVPIRCCSWSVPHDLLQLNKGYSQVCFFTACLLIAPQAKRVPGALWSPFSRRFYNCCCRRTFFSPNNQNNAIQISALSLVPDAKMEPVPTPAALCCILDLNHQVGITLGDNPSLVAGSFQGSLCAFPMKGLFVL